MPRVNKKLTIFPTEIGASNDVDVESAGSKDLEERRLLTKIDLRILPILSLCYIFSFLDRVNIGNAVVFGLSKELNLQGTQYNVALCIFFVPFILLEVCTLFR